MSTIVVAWDASPQSAPALDLAIGYARARDADLVIAHGRTHAIEPDADAELERIKTELTASGLRVRSIVRVSLMGDEAEFVADAARETGAELIVMGSRGRTAIAGAVLGSTSQRILHEAPCPVMIVPVHTKQPDAAAMPAD